MVLEIAKRFGIMFNGKKKCCITVYSKEEGVSKYVFYGERPTSRKDAISFPGGYLIAIDGSNTIDSDKALFCTGFCAKV